MVTDQVTGSFTVLEPSAPFADDGKHIFQGQQVILNQVVDQPGEREAVRSRRIGPGGHSGSTWWKCFRRDLMEWLSLHGLARKDLKVGLHRLLRAFSGNPNQDDRFGMILPSKGMQHRTHGLVRDLTHHLTSIMIVVYDRETELLRNGLEGRHDGDFQSLKEMSDDTSGGDSPSAVVCPPAVRREQWYPRTCSIANVNAVTVHLQRVEPR